MKNPEIAEMIVIRDYKPEDKSFIMATFLRGLYHGDSWFSQIPKDIFMANYKLILENLLLRANTKVVCLRDSEDVILGYSILSQDFATIHFVYVKKPWRKQGIGRTLIPQYPQAVSHLTALGRQLLPKFKDCVFNPFAI